MTSDRATWVEYGLTIAWAASIRSEDQWMRVGACVLRRDYSIAATGYNGAPAGVEIDFRDRELRRPFVVHAEPNAFRYCTPDDTRGGYLFVTHLPCHDCIKVIAAYGIADVHYMFGLDRTVYDVPKIEAIAQKLGLRLCQHQPPGGINVAAHS